MGVAAEAEMVAPAALCCWLAECAACTAAASMPVPEPAVVVAAAGVGVRVS